MSTGVYLSSFSHFFRLSLLFFLPLVRVPPLLLGSRAPRVVNLPPPLLSLFFAGRELLFFFLLLLSFLSPFPLFSLFPPLSSLSRARFLLLTRENLEQHPFGSRGIVHRHDDGTHANSPIEIARRGAWVCAAASLCIECLANTAKKRKERKDFGRRRRKLISEGVTGFVRL